MPIAQSTTKIYSRDRNIWHISHEGGELEDPVNAAPDHIWMLTKSPKDAPDKPADVTVGFESGRARLDQRTDNWRAFHFWNSLTRWVANTASAGSIWLRTVSSG